MKALVYNEPGSFEIKDVPTPVCKPNQVLIKVELCGICKTDVHIHHGHFISKFPLTPGHEFPMDQFSVCPVADTAAHSFYQSLVIIIGWHGDFADRQFT